jgi:hypothetical protein
MRGIIYLIQPKEFLGTNVFKIGRSEAPTLNRCKRGYGAGTRFLHIMECKFPRILEKKIKVAFRKKFKLARGYEYFEGGEDVIKIMFYQIVQAHADEYMYDQVLVEPHNNNIQRKNIQSNDDQHNDDQHNDDQHNDYQNDNVKSKNIQSERVQIVQKIVAQKPKSIQEMIKLLGNHDVCFDSDAHNTLLLSVLSKDYTMIAKAIAHKNNEVCFHDGSWYRFNGSLWEKCDCNFAMSHLICKFFRLFSQLEDRIIKSALIAECSKYKYFNQINQVKMLVNSRSRKIMSHLKTMLEKEVPLDAFNNLFAFNNGVYDFQNMCFRSINANDLISKSCGVDYVENYENKELMIKELTQMFPDKESMDCFLNYLALSIGGKNNLDMIMILQWINPRNLNQIIHFLKQMFGEYALTFESLDNFTNSQINMSRLGTIRCLIIPGIQSVTLNNVMQLIDHRLPGRVDSNKFKIGIMGMTSEEPQIDHQIIDNISRIVIPEQKFQKMESKPNDLFLLLIEYLGIRCQYDKIKYVMKDNRSDDEKIYDEFIQTRLEQNPDNKEKSSHIYGKFIEWKYNNNKKMTVNSDQMIRTGLNQRIKSVYTYLPSIRINGKVTSGYIGVKYIENRDDDHECSDDDVYDEFIQNCLVRKKGHKEKASDILTLFFKWKEKHEKILTVNVEKKIRTRLNTRIKSMYEYKLSMRFDYCTTSGYVDVKCIYY